MIVTTLVPIVITSVVGPKAVSSGTTGGIEVAAGSGIVDGGGGGAVEGGGAVGAARGGGVVDMVFGRGAGSGAGGGGPVGGGTFEVVACVVGPAAPAPATVTVFVIVTVCTGASSRKPSSCLAANRVVRLRLRRPGILRRMGFCRAEVEGPTVRKLAQGSRHSLCDRLCSPTSC